MSNALSLTSDPAWLEDVKLETHPALAEDVRADVCVVGAGIAGMTTAYLLAREGQSVVVLDDGPVGGGQTCMTTAHLSNAIDDRFQEVERVHGQEGSRLAADSHGAAIDRIEAIIRQEMIDCDFTRLDGYLIAAAGDAEMLEKEFQAARRAGVRGVELLARPPVASFGDVPCIRFPRQGTFHPLKYLAGLSRAFWKLGGRVYNGTHAAHISGGRPAEVTTARGPKVTSGAIVVATNTPVNDKVAIHTKQAPYMTYVVGLRVPRGAVPPALYWDTLDPYHYVRLARLPASASDGDGRGLGELLIVGGEDHKSGQVHDTDKQHLRVEEWARNHFPMATDVAFRWSGQVMETIDGLGFIGRNPGDKENVFIATGDSGMGMTHGTIAGMLLTDLILGRTNPWEKLYDPSRKPMAAAGEYLKENLNVAGQYFQWLTVGEVRSVNEIVPDSGAILRRGLTKVAVYRDENGGLHECSAVCPHLGCIVAWNDTEKTWDCPCHGSRFNRQGVVINGPANKNLGPTEQA